VTDDIVPSVPFHSISSFVANDRLRLMRVQPKPRKRVVRDMHRPSWWRLVYGFNAKTVPCPYVPPPVVVPYSVPFTSISPAAG
jgi:hypothetical protein